LGVNANFLHSAKDLKKHSLQFKKSKIKSANLPLYRGFICFDLLNISRKVINKLLEL
tara:strand:+ start:301 stop:471 length:171 start_codon:yes stop_codon:yes gene_type:complete